MDIDELLSNFDVLSFFNARNIDYETEGENVTSGWVNIQCLFCIDHKNHLGINLESKLFHCWICGEKGTAIRLIQEIDSISFHEALLVINEFKEDLSLDPYLPMGQEEIIDPHGSLPHKTLYPEPMFNNIPQLHWKYLELRGFDPEFVWRKFRLKATMNIVDPKFSKFKFRIIIPVIMNRKEVTFTARSVSDTAPVKYLHCSDENSIIPIKETLYNFDTVKGSGILMEGPTDVWKFGDGSFCGFGTQLTAKQFNQMAMLKRLIVMFDADAAEKAERLAEKLTGIVREILIYDLPYGDPAEFTEEEVEYWRNEFDV